MPETAAAKPVRGLILTQKPFTGNPEGKAILRRRRLGHSGEGTVSDIRVADCFTTTELTADELRTLGSRIADPVSQDFFLDDEMPHATFGADSVISVSLKPGMRDTRGETAGRVAMKLFGRKTQPEMHFSRLFLVNGIDPEELAGELANRTVQDSRISVMDRTLAGTSDTIELPYPKVELEKEPVLEYIDLGLPDEGLVKLSSMRGLALNRDEMRTISGYFSNDGVKQFRRAAGLEEHPTDVELETLAQTWSEHCKHKIFNARVRYTDGTQTQQIDSLFKTFIRRATEQIAGRPGSPIVSTLWDNAGVVKFNDKYNFVFKCETHNSPSKVYPYGGAYTGIAGVYRDPMGTGMGVELLYGTWAFCTGSPFYDGDLMPDIHPRAILEGVREGVEHGGNRHGVPTVHGRTFFNEGFIGKPAIYVLAAGLQERTVAGRPGHEKNAFAGDLIVMAGGRVGIDGIHGATISSVESGTVSQKLASEHVQIGDSWTQKKLHDFQIEAMRRGLINCVTDNGAGGLSSSVGEMGWNFGRKTDNGANGFEIDLSHVPLKYTGLDYWQIWISEAQERMTYAVSPDKIEELQKLAKIYDVEATVLGRFTDTGRFHVKYGEKTVACMDINFVHKGLSGMELNASWNSPDSRCMFEPAPIKVKDHSFFLKRMLARENIASTEYIDRQFDHEVGGKSVIKSYVGAESDVCSDAVVMKPDFGSDEGIAIASGLNPDYSEIDTYHMTANAIDEAIRRIIAVGGSFDEWIVLNDNFCWPSPLPGEKNPEAEYRMGQLVRANQALYDTTTGYGTACIAGKDSMSMNGFEVDKNGAVRKVTAPPTMQISSAGKIADIKKCITMDAKAAGDYVYVLGETRNELGGSEFYLMSGERGRNVPVVDVGRNKKLYTSFSNTVQNSMVSSAHGCYKGGLGVALAQAAFAGGGFGMELDLSLVPMATKLKEETILYSESSGRFVVTVAPERAADFEAAMAGNAFSRIGMVTESDSFVVRGYKTEKENTPAENILINESIYGLKDAWKSTFREF
jgi:phosphoribosylformylglycinamidine synthase